MNAAIVRTLGAADPAFEKLLSDNRDLYLAQSKATRGGKVAAFPTKPLRVVSDTGRDAKA